MEKKSKVGILFASFGPYHACRIKALSDALSLHNATLTAFRFSLQSDTYSWSPASPDAVPVITLSNYNPSGLVGAFRLALSFYLALRREKIGIVFLPSFSPLPNLLCFIIAKFLQCRTVLMTESWRGTERAPMIGKWVKHIIVRSFDSALVGGSPQLEYLCFYGMNRAKIFKGYDVVDNDYYITKSTSVRHASSSIIPGLPAHYFLSLGRLVEKKNLSFILRAYSLFLCHLSSPQYKSGDLFASYSRFATDPSLSQSSIFNLDVADLNNAIPSLVIVGDGPLRQVLEDEAHSLGVTVRDGIYNPVCSGAPEIVFYPFQQVETTPLFYSKCTAFILASIYEEWGLVVNEAMACGVPVAVSNCVGSSFDLVEDGVNGFIFPPNDCQHLAEIFMRLATDNELIEIMSRNSLSSIQSWSPKLFGDSGIKAINAALAS